jgi:hypothetical protein
VARIVVWFLVLTLFPTVARAQLRDTEWTEYVLLRGNELTAEQWGEDDLAPEYVSRGLVSGSVGCLGSVEFGPPGPPQGTASVHATSESEDVRASAVFTVEFDARVQETSSPSVSVTHVPVSVSVAGSATASGDSSLPATAVAVFFIRHDFTIPVLLRAEAGNAGEGSVMSDSFEETVTIDIQLGLPLECQMRAVTEILAEPGIGRADATAFLDPVIEVADEPIPGTTDSYRDHYEVELGPGYYALGQPTPILPSTWGRVKSSY